MSILDFLIKKKGKSVTINPVVLVSLDGWGLAPPSAGNAITLAKTPNMDFFYANYPHGELIASGESVGLPATEVGNSEVGHLTMGVGRVIYQSLKRINISIEDGTFYENEAFAKAIKYAREHQSKLHIMGLASHGNVHSNIDHLYALLQFCKKADFKNVYLHLFTDGRDAPPKEGLSVVDEVQTRLNFLGLGSIATVSGRYYAMDRDARWERIQKTYDAMVLGEGLTANTAHEAVANSYAAGKTDEFVEPTVIAQKGAPGNVGDNDACIYFNFRVDRARELTMSFTLPDFENAKVEEYGLQKESKEKTGDIATFQRAKVPAKLFFATMTQYEAKIPVSAVAFPPQFNFPDSFPEILLKHNMKMLDLAESEKESMVTYYFRGMRQDPYANETIDIIHSPRVPTYDKAPGMSADKLVAELKKALDKDIYSFVVMNFANPDMVAHSGSLTATIKAIEFVDKCLGEVYHFVTKKNGVMLISADHGNAEELLTYPTKTFFYTTNKGLGNTDHSSNPVPIIIMSNSLKGKNVSSLRGTLADIAPTICGIMKLGVPSTMTGKNLLAGLNK